MIPTLQGSKLKVVGWSAAFLLALIATSLVFQKCRGQNELSQTVRDSIAAVEASRKPDSLAHAINVAHSNNAATSSTRSGVASDRLDVVSRQSEQHGISLRAFADSVARLASLAATAHDSAVRFAIAWEKERAHADTLQRSLDTSRASRDSMRVSRDSARSALRAMTIADSGSQSRLARVERLNADLKRDAERISSGCQLLPFVRCPTRKELIVAGVLGAVIVHKRDQDHERELSRTTSLGAEAHQLTVLPLRK